MSHFLDVTDQGCHTPKAVLHYEHLLPCSIIQTYLLGLSAAHSARFTSS